MDYMSEHATIIKDIDGTTDVTLDKGMKNAGATVPLVKNLTLTLDVMNTRLRVRSLIQGHTRH
jgi:hypothetical protein